MLDYVLTINQPSETFQPNSPTLSALLFQAAKRIVLSTAIVAIADRKRKSHSSPTATALIFDQQKPITSTEHKVLPEPENNAQPQPQEPTLKNEEQTTQQQQPQQQQIITSPKLPLKSCLRSPKSGRLASSGHTPLVSSPLVQSHPVNTPFSPIREHSPLSQSCSAIDLLSVSPSFPSPSDILTLPLPGDSTDPFSGEETTSTPSEGKEHQQLIDTSQNNDSSLELWNPVFSDQPVASSIPRRTHRRRVSWSDIDKGKPLTQEFQYAGKWDRKPFCLQRRATRAQNALYFKVIVAIIIIYVLLAFCFLLKFLRSSAFPFHDYLQSPLLPNFLSRS